MHNVLVKRKRLSVRSHEFLLLPDMSRNQILLLDNSDLVNM